MKNILVILSVVFTTTLGAQVRRDTALTPLPPVYNPYQFPNFYQNNSMFNNNSMQTNPPRNPFAGPYTGNANYTDPTRSAPGPATYNSTNVSQPQQPVTQRAQNK